MQKVWNKIANQRKWYCVLLFLLCFFCFGQMETKAEETEEKEVFFVNLDFGIKGNLKVCENTPVTVEICSQNSDFEGTMQIVVQIDEYSNKTAYEQKISLKKKETAIYEMVIPKQYYSISYNFRILDEKNRTVYSNPCSNYSVIDFHGAVMGVVSDSVEQFENLDDYTISEKPEVKNKLVYLETEELPEQQSRWNELDYLLMDEAVVEELTPEQTQSMREWVQNGGAVILLTEENVTLPEEEQQSTNDVTVVKEDLFDGQIAVLSKEEWNALREENREQMVDALFSAFPEKKQELQHIAEWENNYTDYTGLLSFYDDFQKLPVSWYMFLMLFYVLMIGPVLYLFFKRRKKREYLWFGIGGMAVLFAIVVLAGSRRNRVEEPVVTTLTVFNSANQEDATVYSQIQSPDNGTVTVEFQDNITNMLSMQDPYTEEATGLVDCRISQKENRYSYTKEYMNCFGTVTQISQLADSKEVASFEADLTVRGEQLTGKITNVSGRKLTDVVAYYRGFYYYVEELNPEEQWELAENSERRIVNTHAYENYFSTMPDTGKSNQGRRNMARIEDEIYIQYLLQNNSNKVVIFGLDWEYEGNYVKSDITECDKAVFMQEVSSGVSDNQIYFVGINSNNIAESNAEWTVGKDGRYYEFEECELSCMVSSEYTPQKLILTEPVDSKELQLLVYNYRTNRYDDVFANGNMELSKRELASYMHYGEMKLKYVSLKGWVSEGKGTGITIPRIDLLAEE